MQHNKLKRGSSLFLSVCLILFVFFIPVAADDHPAYVDITPKEHYWAGNFSSPVPILCNTPSWFANSGYSSVPMKVYVIGAFRGCFPLATSSYSTSGNLISSGSIGSVSNVPEQVYSLVLDGGSQTFYVHNDLNDSQIPYFEIHHIYAELPSWDGSLLNVGFYPSKTTGFPSVSFPDVSLPYSFAGDEVIKDYWVKIPSSKLALSTSVAIDFEFSSGSGLFSTFAFSSFSGSQQVPHSYTNNGSYWSITVNDYDPSEDLYIWCRLDQPGPITIKSCSVHYGLLLDEAGLLSIINERLHRNFASIIEILDSNNSWLGRIHTAISNGFTSVGSWFTSLWNNIASKFTDLQGWIQAQTDTLAGKLDILINGSAAQQEAVQQQQQINQNLQTNINNANSSLQQAGSSLSAVSKPSDVNMSLDGLGVDYSSLILLTSPITGDSLIGPIMGLLAVLMLLSYVIFGRKG